MLYQLFLALNFVLFLRPAEWVSGLRALPIYQVTILACLITAAPVILQLIQQRNLKLNPITCCVVLLLFVVPLSHFTQLTTVSIYYGRIAFEDFGKLVLYYLVAFAALRNQQKFESFLRWLLIMITLVAVMSLGHERGIFFIPELAAIDRDEQLHTGEQLQIRQLRGTGIFNDPNDLAMILTIGVVLAIHVIMSPQTGFAKTIALPALGICILGLYETKSRGGMLAFLAAGCVLSYARWGLSRAILIGGAAASLVAAVFALRGGSGAEGGTAQHRIRLWSEGLGELRNSPLFGIGYDRYAKEMGQVAHNSFVHCFTELGLLGGSLFLGAFLASILALWRLWRLDEYDLPQQSRQRLVTVFAGLVGASVAMLSLSRSYVVPTYLILALGASAIAIESRRLEEEEVWIELPRFDGTFFAKLAKCTIAFLGVTYVFIRLNAHWG